MKTIIPFATALLCMKCASPMGVSPESHPDTMQFAEVERHGGGRGKWRPDRDWTREECEEWLGGKRDRKEWWCEKKNDEVADDDSDGVTNRQECLNDVEAWYLNAVDEKCPVSCVDQALADLEEDKEELCGEADLSEETC